MNQIDPNEREPLPFGNPGATHNEAMAQAPAEVGVVTEQFVMPSAESADDALRSIRDLMSQNMSPTDTADALERLTADVSGVSASFMTQAPQPAPVPQSVPQSVPIDTSQSRERNMALVESMKNTRNASGLLGHLLEIIDTLHRRSDGRFSYDEAVEFLCDTANVLRDPDAQKTINLLAASPRLD
jgi:hypothetical protein